MTTHVNPPEKTQEAFYVPTDISPDDLFEALGRLRKEAEDEIERLLAFLDKTDVDPDLEPAGDELDASYPEGGVKLLAHPNEDDEPDVDDEDGNDREEVSEDEGAEDGDREPDVDGEPSLGWTEGYAAGTAAIGTDTDREIAAPPKRVKRKDARERLDNIDLVYSGLGKPRFRRGKPANPPGICNLTMLDGSPATLQKMMALRGQTEMEVTLYRI